MATGPAVLEAEHRTFSRALDGLTDSELRRRFKNEMTIFQQTVDYSGEKRIFKIPMCKKYANYLLFGDDNDFREECRACRGIKRMKDCNYHRPFTKTVFPSRT
jgi:hypothetical protein